MNVNSAPSAATLVCLTLNHQDFIRQHSIPGTVLGSVQVKFNDTVTALGKQTIQLNEIEGVQSILDSQWSVPNSLIELDTPVWDTLSTGLEGFGGEGRG